MLQQIIFKTAGLGLNLWSLVAPNAAAMAAYQLFCKPPQPNIRPKVA